MAKRIVTGFTLAALLTAAFFGYRSWNARRSLNSGEVFEDTGDGSPANTLPASRASSPPPAASAGSPQAPVIPAQSAGFGPPADSNAASAARVTGPGRFQVYRQGDLTFRIDTVTGTTCILFATHAEWRKPEVFNQGCNTAK